MRAYHFIKYNERTSLNRFVSKIERDIIFCFDFEDSIQDCFNASRAAYLKSIYRSYFKKIISNCSADRSKLKIGVRINSSESPEYILDLIALAGENTIHTIFLPKIFSSKQILDLEIDLINNGINVTEIIPVIETKQSMNCLSDILKNKSDKVQRIAFGHCDYNFDIGNYPFFHQDSREYWIWITQIYDIAKSNNLGVINSPLLELNNHEGFNGMLSTLYSITGDNCAQITLTKKQTQLCNDFSYCDTVAPKLNNRLNLKVPNNFATIFIETFRNNCNDKGFAINSNKILLSPQEYSSSLKYLNKQTYPEINFTFVGGCFPVQNNICFEDLFHQHLKNKIEAHHSLKFNINIIRYERFKNCVRKVESYMDSNLIDVLVFSIRPEPFLRLVKFYYKYLDTKTSRIKHSLNLPFLNKINPEKHDLLSMETCFTPTISDNSSIFRKLLINLNYFAGSLIRNDRYALREYFLLVKQLTQLCNENNIRLIIFGPPTRTNTFLELQLSKKLERFMKANLEVPNKNFISGSDCEECIEASLKKNGTYVNEKYHKLIAERIFKKLIPKAEEISLVQEHTLL